MEDHPNVKQKDVVHHFANCAEAVLKFTQGALLKKLQKKDELCAHASSDPTALSSKRARIVTRPDVEEVLIIWQSSMEKRLMSVTSLMLIEK
ncbi:hypothetical protein PM082_023390 [Marasmius tenuissimus]|nr:hypothetical protein PM082_023390 [Marasmius tenuissimus]